MIKAIQHHCNDIRTKPLSPWGEIDLQIDDDGRLVVKHDPDEPYPSHLDYVRPRYSSFLINIKQNLHERYYARIEKELAGQIIGFIDVPPPSLIFLQDYPIYERVSEFENCSSYAKRCYIDPLKSQRPADYFALFNKCPPSARVIITSPDLHGLEAKETLEQIIFLCGNRIDGILTKNPVEVQKLC